MAKKEVAKKSESTPKTTRNGNKLFEGAKDGKPFVKGVPKTEEERKAISKGMQEAFFRRKVYAELLGKLLDKLGLKLENDEIGTENIIKAIDTLIKALGDNVNKTELIGSLGVHKVFITQEEKAETDKHIDDFINHGASK